MTANLYQNYTFWTLLDNYALEIPIIQRDYAQGRSDERTQQIRNDFLTTLHHSLTKKQTVNLDFIYGSLNSDNKLILLDGQQRLTTLFLLHWYFLNACDEKTHQAQINKLKKFSYETRISSRLFCEALCKRKIDFKSQEYPNISAQIKDSSWFFRSWTKDPTVSAMLEMLDAIQAKFEQKDLVNYWQALTNSNKALISFQFLDMKEFKLTDDLYVKMNARGKALTDFENFKAWLEKYAEPFDIAKDWTEKLDTTWADLFWGLNNQNFDDAYLSFFKGMGLLAYLENIKLPSKKQALDEKDDALVKMLHGGEDYIPVSDYEKTNCFNSNSLTNIIKILDTFTELPHLGHDLLKSFINKPTYWQRAQFYAVCQFILHNESQFDLLEHNIDFERWCRVCSNLINNTPIDNSYDFSRVLHAIRSLSNDVFSSNTPTILTYLQTIDNLKLDYLSNTQQKEEVLKAKLIKENLDWENAIIKAENHNYFYGQIKFILKMAFINNQYDLKLFTQYAEKLAILFSFNYLNDRDFTFQRALLCKGNYLIYSGANYDFCSPKHNTLRDREYNWRKVFRDKQEEQRRRGYLKSLLDDVSVNNMKNSLEQIIKKSPAKNYCWTDYFIQCPQAIKYCINHQIRVEDDSQNKVKIIFLLEKERMSGTHSELRSVYFYEKYLKTIPNEALAPFNQIGYEKVAGSSEKPYAYLDGWHYQNAELYLSIVCHHHDNNEFIIYLTDEKKNVGIPKDVEQLLQNFNFVPSKNDSYSMELHLITDEATLLEKIKNLLIAFNQFLLVNTKE